MSFELAEVLGRVLKIIKEGKSGTGPIFTILCPQINKEFLCDCTSFFCPVHEGDAFHAICTMNESNPSKITLVVQRPPFVTPATDKQSVLRTFIRVLRGTGFGNTKACMFYDELSHAYGGDGNVVSGLSDLAALWWSSQDESLFSEYKSINKNQMKTLLIWWHKHRSLRRLYLLGLTNKEIEECKMPLDEIYEKCLKNPYVLYPISMEKCKEILLRQNIEGKPLDERCGLIVRKIWDMMNERAWTGIGNKIMKSMFKDIEKNKNYLLSEFRVKHDYDTYYLNYPYNVESSVAERIEKLIRKNKVDPMTPMDTPLRESANFKCTTLTNEQKIAIQGALDYNITVITGGAGHGKSKIIEEIVHNNDLRGINTCMAAFTGKAVSRIREMTGRRSPSTLHRLIFRAGMTPKFTHLIIDEASMVTTELFGQFLRTFKDFYKITLVGDINQLQPIGWGSLFEELIKSGAAPVYRLTVNHRVEVNNGPKAEQNGILINSNNIINAEKGKTFHFIQTKNFSICNENIDHVSDIITQLYNGGVPAEDITIITPYNKDVDALNKMAQEIFNDGKESVVDSRGTLWMVGDRVMLTENNYDINVFNGETGQVTEVNDMFITVVFGDGASRAFLLEKPVREEVDMVKQPKIRQEGDLVVPDKDNNDDLYVTSLIHSFAITVHRSQGSEFPYCIIYVPPNKANSSFLTRNLLYVAVSRAKRACWIVSPVVDSVEAAAHRLPPYRCENLAKRLLVAFPQEEFEEVEDVDDILMYI